MENSAVASDIAERAPLGHSNRSDPFSFVNSVVAGRVPMGRWCEPTEPTGEKGKELLLFISPLNWNLAC